MSRRLLVLLTLAAVAIAPTTLRAQGASFSVAGGLAAPQNDLGKTVQSGYNAAIGLNFSAPLVPLGARIEGGLNSFNYKGSTSGDFRVMNVTANGIFSMGMPYLIAGLGYYNAREKATVGALTTEVTQSGMGVNAGAGLRFPLGALSPFVEARYHAMLGDKNKGVHFVPITFGVSF
jgi:hypothetical protein